jgi:hypothetical protein
MLVFAGLASPRKLTFFAVAVFLVVVLFLQSSPYRQQLPSWRPSTSASEGQPVDQDQTKPEPPSPNHAFKPEDDVESKIEVGEFSQTVSTPIAPSRSGPDLASKQDAKTTAPVTSSAHIPSAVSQTVVTTPQEPTSTRTTVKHTFKTLSHPPYKKVHSMVQEVLAQWTPPAIPNHWPPYGWYGTQRDYDPNRWEGFEWENDYYINNGVKKLKEEYPAAATPVPYLPYPDYESSDYKNKWQGDYVPCEGPRGKLLNDSLDDIVKAYPVTLNGFPNVTVGDAGVTGIDIEHCFDRYNRFGPYGYKQEEMQQVLDWAPPSVNPDWESVNWGELQERCMIANRERFHANARQPMLLRPGKDLPYDHAELHQPDLKSETGRSYRSRTALLIRTWEGYVYTSNDIENIRSLVTELSLLSGGEYQVFLLVDVKDRSADIYGNEQVYKDMLEQFVPRELQSISILWTQDMLQEWYPKVGSHEVYWHQFMPLQWFSKKYPEFDYIWNWETDARYIGNHYHLLEQLRQFAAKQPRKYLWERNARFYFPSAHGTYDAWLDDTHAAVQTGIKNGCVEPVWGAQPYNASWQNPIGPEPPHAIETDDFEWGVGEEADLITLQPIWEPTHTEWTMRDKIWNFLPGIRPHFSEASPIDEGFTHPEFANIPRRAYINTLSRLSRRQLHAMHLENLAGRTMQAEMWPATAALHHGLKAVYAPHPIWSDHRWPAWYMDSIFNADGNEAAKWGARSDSVYNHDREHNFAGWSWYYASDFPHILYRRWLGWAANIGPEKQYPNNPLLNVGGEEFEGKGVKVQIPPRTADGKQAAPAGSNFGGVEMTVGGKGRMCLPPMLLHPIKRVYRGAEDDDGNPSP